MEYNRGVSRNSIVNRKANGLCVQCGDRAITKTLCKECALKASYYAATRRSKHKKEGLCTQCSGIPIPGKTLCVKCDEMAKKAHHRSRSGHRGRFGKIVSSAKSRASQSGFIFDEVILSMLIETCPTKCACCSIELDFSSGQGRTRQNYSPSLDRVDNTQGYTIENTRVICWKCNFIKGVGSADDHERIAAYMRKHQSSNKPL